MATLTTTPFSFRLCASSTNPIRSHETITTNVRLLPSTMKKLSSLKLFTSSHSISAGFFSSINPNNNRSPFSSLPLKKPQSLSVHCHKGYKMKTHKASAKRFRVTGKGKIMRRRSGKQHLLAKKNTKRKNRLSKALQVDRSDYNNVIGALPYLKVNRNN
ncbi:hypothetical protein LguiA_018818 [Lonicera macranthoides]